MRARSGQSTVELALVVTLLLSIFAIGADLARVFYVALAVANSSREAAEYAAAQSSNSDASAIRDVARTYGAPYVVPSNVFLEPWDSTGPPGPGEPLKVTVEATFSGILLPIRNIPIKSVTRMRRNCPAINGRASCSPSPPIP